MPRGPQIKVRKLPNLHGKLPHLDNPAPPEWADQALETSIPDDFALESDEERKEPVKTDLPPIPKPPYFKFTSTAPKGQRPDDFFGWWVGLDVQYQERLTAYVYRNWPTIQIRVPAKKSATGFRVSCQIDKLLGNQPIGSIEDLIHRYGCGDYTVRLNDQIGERGSIALCIIKGERDLQDHPPVIHPGTLMLDDPANGSYIEFLRLKGADLPGLERIEDMRTDTSASDRLAETVERMADQNIRLAGEAVKAAGKQEKPPEQARSSDQDTLLTSMKIVQQVS